MTPRNSRERLVDYMSRLRRHTIQCYTCKGAIAAEVSDAMCNTGRTLTVSAAKEFTNVIELRRKAYAQGVGIIHACPDLSKHGEAYAMTAMPFHVTGVQGELF